MHLEPIAFLLGALLLAAGSALGAPVTAAFFASLALGSVSLGTVGGATFQLFVPLAGLLVATAAFRPTFWRDLERVFRLNWMPVVVVVLLLYTLASAFILPRLFAGDTTVFVSSLDGVVETALRPVPGNINQSAYFTMGVLAFFAVASRLSREGSFELLRTGFFAFAGFNAFLGIVDLAGKASGAGDLLAPIRTAQYSMLVEVQVEGFWRIVGGYPEASTFAAGTTIALAFTFSYWRATSWRPPLLLSCTLLALLILATSSTGYASLAIVSMLLAFSLAWRMLRARLSTRDLATMLASAVGLAILLGIVITNESLLVPAKRLIEETLINKSTSASADERFYWNLKSWMAFVDTYGLGIGIGSSRASSSIIAVLSQLGAVGASLIVLLVIDLARPLPRPGPDPTDREIAAICNGLRTAGLVSLVPPAIAGGTADPGIVFFIALAGVAVGRDRLARRGEFPGASMPAPRPMPAGGVSWSGVRAEATAANPPGRPVRPPVPRL